MTNDTSHPTPQQDQHTRDTLKARAQAMAQAPADAVRQSTLITLLEFSLAKERYAVDLTHVREVSRLTHLTPVPGTPPFVAGLINLRGQFICVIDIKNFFDLPAPGITDLHAAIVIQHAGAELGILADTIIGMRTIQPDTLQPSLPTLTDIRAEYLKGITPDHTVVLDALKLLASPRTLVDQGSN